MRLSPRGCLVGVLVLAPATTILGSSGCGAKYEESEPEAGLVSSEASAFDTFDAFGTSLDASPQPLDAGGDAPADADADASEDAGDALPVDAATCDLSKVASDPDNCGRCGHGCGGASCIAGRCQATLLATISQAPLWHIALSEDAVFVSTSITLTTQVGGIWRIPKTGGVTKHTDLRYATSMAVFNGRIYFASDDEAVDAGPGGTGGLWSCPVTVGPCTPTLHAALTDAQSTQLSGQRILFGSQTPSAISTLDVTTGDVTPVFPGYNPRRFFADGNSLFYLGFTLAGGKVSLWWSDVVADLDDDKELSVRQKSLIGTVTGTSADVIFTSYSDLTGIGVVRRVPRPDKNTGHPSCDYGGETHNQPHALLVDDGQVYWTNLGKGSNTPAGSVKRCALDGCCDTADTLWTGSTSPSAIASDASFLYFATREGEVYRVAKP